MTVPNLTRRLTLENPVRTPDGAGGYSQSWTALGDLWAAVSPATGREANREGLTGSTVTYKIVVRAAPPGDPARPGASQRFREGDRIFHIRAVTEQDALAHYLICWAEEEVVA